MPKVSGSCEAGVIDLHDLRVEQANCEETRRERSGLNSYSYPSFEKSLPCSSVSRFPVSIAVRRCYLILQPPRYVNRRSLLPVPLSASALSSSRICFSFISALEVLRLKPLFWRGLQMRALGESDWLTLLSRRA